MIHACRGWPAIKNGIFGGHLEALELRKLNPASCHIPTLLSATAPPSPSIVYHPYGAIMPAFLRHRHHPLPNHNNHVYRYSFFPSISRTDRSMGSLPPIRANLTHIGTLAEQAIIGYNWFSRSGTSAFGHRSSGLSPNSLAKSPANLPTCCHCTRQNHLRRDSRVSQCVRCRKCRDRCRCRVLQWKPLSP